MNDFMYLNSLYVTIYMTSVGSSDAISIPLSPSLLEAVAWCIGPCLEVFMSSLCLPLVAIHGLGEAKEFPPLSLLELGCGWPSTSEASYS